MKQTQSNIFVVNGGSSSIKFAIFEVERTIQKILVGKIERIGLPMATLHITSPIQTHNLSKIIQAPDYSAAIEILMSWMREYQKKSPISAIGHRIVHGGSKYRKPQVVTAEMIEELRQFVFFDPEHLTGEIELIKQIYRHFPKIPQIACFDTAFHQEMPRIAQLLPIPRHYEKIGLRRYGFHGLSYEYLMDKLAQIAGAKEAKGRIVLAHLGNGASLAAVHGGRSIDTSMGFTPIAGIPMSTRTGDLDPGIVLYLANKEGVNAKVFNNIVNFKSGLLGVSEISSDMRELLDCEKNDIRAREAIELFCYQIKKWVGAFAAALGGLDTLVFAGGIGENAPRIRARICAGLEFLGVQIDEDLNKGGKNLISSKSGQVKVRVIQTDEEVVIAKAAASLLNL
jgi:acetate kinase